MCICNTVLLCSALFSASDSVNTNLSLDSNTRDSMKVAMEKLEERFTRTMKEVAVLSDEKQRLEHLVLQLQGETETIGKICFLQSFCVWLLGNILLLNFLKLNVMVIVSTYQLSQRLAILAEFLAFSSAPSWGQMLD